METEGKEVEHIEVDYTHLCPSRTVQEAIDFLYIRGGLEYWYPQVKDLETKDKILFVYFEENLMPRRFTHKHLMRRLFARLPKHLVKRLKTRVVLAIVGEVLDRKALEERTARVISEHNPWVAPACTEFNPFLPNAAKED